MRDHGLRAETSVLGPGASRLRSDLGPQLRLPAYTELPCTTWSVGADFFLGGGASSQYRFTDPYPSPHPYSSPAAAPRGAPSFRPPPPGPCASRARPASPRPSFFSAEGAAPGSAPIARRWGPNLRPGGACALFSLRSRLRRASRAGWRALPNVRAPFKWDIAN